MQFLSFEKILCGWQDYGICALENIQLRSALVTMHAWWVLLMWSTGDDFPLYLHAIWFHPASKLQDKMNFTAIIENYKLFCVEWLEIIEIISLQRF